MELEHIKLRNEMNSLLDFFFQPIPDSCVSREEIDEWITWKNLEFIKRAGEMHERLSK